MTVSSSASEGLQTNIRENMQNQQQEISGSEADNAQIQKMLGDEKTMFTVGNFNA